MAHHRDPHVAEELINLLPKAIHQVDPDIIETSISYAASNDAVCLLVSSIHSNKDARVRTIYLMVMHRLIVRDDFQIQTFDDCRTRPFSMALSAEYFDRVRQSLLHAQSVQQALKDLNSDKGEDRKSGATQLGRLIPLEQKLDYTKPIGLQPDALFHILQLARDHFATTYPN